MTVRPTGDEVRAMFGPDDSLPASHREPTLVTRACLVCAALLPWVAVLSGTYGLYFYILLAAVLVAPWLLIPALVLAAPLSMLLLVLLPGGAVYAALHRAPSGWFAWITRAGCVVSMVFTVVYGGLMLLIGVAPMFADGPAERWDFSPIWRVAVLTVGLMATWRSWRWLCRQPDYT